MTSAPQHRGLPDAFRRVSEPKAVRETFWGIAHTITQQQPLKKQASGLLLSNPLAKQSAG